LFVFLLFTFDAAALCVFVILSRVGCVVWKEARFELPLACCCLLMCLAGFYPSNVVDILDANSGRWSTAALSQARQFLAATSLPSQGLAIFAGGITNGLYFCC
jgi:hypothetical protein